ncbi:MAG TPA: alkaline phosphatase family protein [Streptosporangiaceae bacterium]
MACRRSQQVLLWRTTTGSPPATPGQKINQANLPSQLQAADKTWKGYYQGMPYPGYRGYRFRAKCNGIPDSDTLYVAKHNGIPNFANLQTPAEFANQLPYGQLSADLAAGRVPNFSYIIPDECHDMHGAPPWCTDSGKAGDAHDNWLVATDDAFVGSTVTQITSSPVWQSGNNAIVVTFDEGNTAQSQIATIVITNHGPRGVADNTSYNHYNLLASLEQAFGLGCLQNACAANPMTPLFQVTGSTSVPALPAPLIPPPNGTTRYPRLAAPTTARARTTCSAPPPPRTARPTRSAGTSTRRQATT